MGERIYDAAMLMAAGAILALAAALVWMLYRASGESIQRFGLHYVTGSVWDETTTTYGILPFLFGTFYSSLIALLLAVPVSIGAAIFLSEIAPSWLRTPAAFLIELQAAVPSVIYGLWGIFILIPWLRDRVMTPIAASKLPGIPVIGALFTGDPIGPGMLAAGVVLAIMIIPSVTAVSREVLRAVPQSQREGALGLGATWWETISGVVLPAARSGIIGAVILGLGRAAGETMAVTMVIGNQTPANPSGISPSLFEPGYTMASALANKFNEATPGIGTAALVEIGLWLLIVTVVVNVGARFLVRLTARDMRRAV